MCKPTIYVQPPVNANALAAPVIVPLTVNGAAAQQCCVEVIDFTAAHTPSIVFP